jgi:PIN domain nuclease of toxin-antitoxin system
MHRIRATHTLSAASVYDILLAQTLKLTLSMRSVRYFPILTYHLHVITLDTTGRQDGIKQC